MTAFTTDMSTDIGKVRFEVSDMDPDNAKFADDQISYALTNRTVVGAAAVLCGVLATRYAEAADMMVDMAQVRMAHVSASYAAREKRLLERDDAGIGSIHPTRVDGYTEDIASDSNDRSGVFSGTEGSGFGTFDVGRWRQ